MLRLAFLCCVMATCLGPALRAQEARCHATGEQEAHDGRYTRTVESYAIPSITLVDQSGARVDLPDVLEGPEPVALNFIFTTCRTICPVMTATFSRMREELGEGDPLRLVSISIDPEYDTSPVLREYAKRYGADSRRLFLTGQSESISLVLQAFQALTGSKTNHRPLTFLKAPGKGRWIRIEGLVSAADLVREYRKLSGS